MSNSHLFLSLLLVISLGMEVALAKEGDKCKNATMHCDSDECCAGVSPKTLGVCQHQPQLGEKCSPQINPGAKVCPCLVGTTCQIVYSRKIAVIRRLDMNVKKYYKCIQLPTLTPDEEEEI